MPRRYRWATSVVSAGTTVSASTLPFSRPNHGLKADVRGGDRDGGPGYAPWRQRHPAHGWPRGRCQRKWLHAGLLQAAEQPQGRAPGRLQPQLPHWALRQGVHGYQAAPPMRVPRRTATRPLRTPLRPRPAEAPAARAPRAAATRLPALRTHPPAQCIKAVVYPGRSRTAAAQHRFLAVPPGGGGVVHWQRDHAVQASHDGQKQRLKGLLRRLPAQAR
jgi:hypothetical protein